MITLTEFQKVVIKTIKGHYSDKKGKTFFLLLKNDYEETYGYKFKDIKSKAVMLETLIDIWILIKDDNSGSDRQLKSIIYAAMFKSLIRPQKQSIDRTISVLCSLIQINKISGRYEL